MESPTIQKMLKHNLLSYDESLALVEKAQAGDIRARDALITNNMRLVQRIAFNFRRKSRTTSELEDLISFGVLGLMHAITKFDLTKLNPDSGKPYAFSTYVTWWILQEITRCDSRDRRTVKLPAHVITDLTSSLKYVRALERKGTVVTLENLVREFPDVELKVFKAYFNSNDAMVDTDLTFYNEGEGSDPVSFIDNIKCTSNTPEMELELLRGHPELEAALSALTPTERMVVEHRYGLCGREEHTLEQVGAIVGVTRERIRQIQVKALKTMRLHVRLFLEGGL